MSDNPSFELNESTYTGLLKKKNEMGFQDKSWDEWFDFLINENDDESKQNFIEKVFEKKNYERYYDEWVKNFGDNLSNIQKGHSARELIPKKVDDSSAIVIGGGPSLKKHNHLELLAKSNFGGVIVCCDGSLSAALESGVTPDKFKNYFVVTIDTQPHQKQFYENPITKKFGKSIKCILSTTVPLSTYQAVVDSNMDVYWVHALFDYNKGKSSFNYISGILSRSKYNSKGFPGIQTGGNVGTFAWVASWNILKCSEVCLIGMDHSYPVDNPSEKIDSKKIGRIHPQFIEFIKESDKKNSENSDAIEKAFPLTFNPIFNCYSRQDPIFLYYSNALKGFIERTQNRVRTINATEGGVLFGNGIRCMKFKEYLDMQN